MSIITSQEQVTSLAEIGIILLLFTIGLEFSFKDLWKIRLIAIIGGALQVGLSFAFFCGLAFLFGRVENTPNFSFVCRKTSGNTLSE